MGRQNWRTITIFRHLAGYFGHFAYAARFGIPFIFLSPVYKPEVCEIAKQFNPSGFILKPFYGKDVLASLEIAFYRHRISREMAGCQEKWLDALLTNILDGHGLREQKLLAIVRAF